ncbi:MAG: hypothetical protein WD751_11110 [Anaerolineales bacterium]
MPHLVKAPQSPVTLDHVRLILAPACLGRDEGGGEIWTEATPIEGAAAYAGSGIHPIVILHPPGEHSSWDDRINDEWRPLNLENAQLVACVGPIKKEAIELCEFLSGSGITRYRFRIAVRLIGASTGSTLAYQTFYGAPPRACKVSEPMNLGELTGPEVGYLQVAGWLEGIVKEKP